MSSYKYIDWDDHVYKKYWEKKDHSAENSRDFFFREVRDFSSQQVIEHLTEQYQKANSHIPTLENLDAFSEGDYKLRYTWDEIKKCMDDLSESIKQGDVEKTFTSAFRLGMLEKELKYPESIHLKVFHQQQIIEKKEESLKAYNSVKRLYKDVAQEFAKILWSKDKEQKIRIGEMCEILWSEIIDNPQLTEYVKDEFDKRVVDFMPNDAQGLKPWIKDVAPDYAKLGGRPSKSKK